MTGVRWDDVTTLTTPALWSLSREGSVGLVAARSVASRSCPADGWLAVSSGTRAADVRSDDGTCRTLRDPGENGEVPGWEDYVSAADAESYGAQPGFLGDMLAESGTTATGIGPGAAIALADAAGLPVGTHEPLPATSAGLTRAVRDALARPGSSSSTPAPCATRGTRRPPARAPRSPRRPRRATRLDEPSPPEVSTPDAIIEPSRAFQAQVIDARIGAAIAGAQRSGATVLVVSLADSGRIALQLAAATGLAPNGEQYVDSLLTSGSTQQAGLIQTRRRDADPAGRHRARQQRRLPERRRDPARPAHRHRDRARRAAPRHPAARLDGHPGQRRLLDAARAQSRRSCSSPRRSS